MSQPQLIENQAGITSLLLPKRKHRDSEISMRDRIAPRGGTSRRMPVLSREMRQLTPHGVRVSVHHAVPSLDANPGYWHRKSSPASAEIPDSSALEAPVLFIKTLFETWRVTEDAATLLGLDERAAKDLFAGAPLNGRDLKDRIVCLYQIRKNLWSLLRDIEDENEWLREPHDILAGRSPLGLLREGSMENLLLVKEYVDMVAGL